MGRKPVKRASKIALLSPPKKQAKQDLKKSEVVLLIEDKPLTINRAVILPDLKVVHCF